MDDDWPNSHWSQPADPNAPPPTAGAIIFFIGGISLMGALMVFIGFVDGDGEALFWGSCLLLPALVMISKTMQKVVLAILPNTSMSRKALLGEPNEAPSRSPLPLQMSGRGSRLDRYQSVMFRLRLAPSEGQTVASLMAQHKGGSTAARKPLGRSSTIHKWSRPWIWEVPVPQPPGRPRHPQQRKTQGSQPLIW